MLANEGQPNKIPPILLRKSDNKLKTYRTLRLNHGCCEKQNIGWQTSGKLPTGGSNTFSCCCCASHVSVITENDTKYRC